MSKIGKKPVIIPSGVEVKINDSFISVKGPKGELKRAIPEVVEIEIDGDKLRVRLLDQRKESTAIWGLTAALIKNMVKGVVEGFETILEFQGIGYKAIAKDNDLELGLGFSHPIHVKMPEGINFKVEKNTIRISGIDKELVGRVAAEIRAIRKPEPYKGSGIRYRGEVIKRKAGKKAVAAAS